MLFESVKGGNESTELFLRPVCEVVREVGAIFDVPLLSSGKGALVTIGVGKKTRFPFGVVVVARELPCELPSGENGDIALLLSST